VPIPTGLPHFLLGSLQGCESLFDGASSRRSMSHRGACPPRLRSRWRESALGSSPVHVRIGVPSALAGPFFLSSPHCVQSVLTGSCLR